MTAIHLSVDFAAFLKQQLGGLELAVGHGPVHRRAQLLGTQFPVEAQREQHLYKGTVVVARCDVQERDLALAQ